MPKPPGDRAKFERTRITAKLSEVRRTTALGSHEEPQLNAEGKVRTAIVPNQWAFVYGRLVKTPRLDEDCGPDGCGGDDVPLVIIANEQSTPSVIHRRGSSPAIHLDSLRFRVVEEKRR